MRRSVPADESDLAVPSIQEDLGLNESQPQWVMVTYGLAFGGFLLLGGRSADLLGRRNVLVGGLAVFTLASLTAGLAETLTAIVLSRAAQGIGAAFAAPAALSILTSTFPEGAPRNRALGIFGAVGAAAASVGLVVGGALGFNLQLTLFMQQVLGYSAIQAGLAWLATSVAAVVIGIGVAARSVGRFGAGRTLVAGQATTAAGLLWLSGTPADAAYLADLFPGLLLVGVGIGFSGMAVQVAAFIGIDRSIAGVAGGIVESCREVGGAFGTAIIATVVLARSQHLLGGGDADAEVRSLAFAQGMQRGAFVAVAFSVAAAAIAGTFLRRAERLGATDRPAD